MYFLLQWKNCLALSNFALQNLIAITIFFTMLFRWIKFPKETRNYIKTLEFIAKSFHKRNFSLNHVNDIIYFVNEVNGLYNGNVDPVPMLLMEFFKNFADSLPKTLQNIRNEQDKNNYFPPFFFVGFNIKAPDVMDYSNESDYRKNNKILLTITFIHNGNALTEKDFERFVYSPLTSNSTGDIDLKTRSDGFMGFRNQGLKTFIGLLQKTFQRRNTVMDVEKHLKIQLKVHSGRYHVLFSYPPPNTIKRVKKMIEHIANSHNAVDIFKEYISNYLWMSLGKKDKRISKKEIFDLVIDTIKHALGQQTQNTDKSNEDPLKPYLDEVNNVIIGKKGAVFVLEAEAPNTLDLEFINTIEGSVENMFSQNKSWFLFPVLFLATSKEFINVPINIFVRLRRTCIKHNEGREETITDTVIHMMIMVSNVALNAGHDIKAYLVDISACRKNVVDKNTLNEQEKWLVFSQHHNMAQQQYDALKKIQWIYIKNRKGLFSTCRSITEEVSIAYRVNNECKVHEDGALDECKIVDIRQTNIPRIFDYTPLPQQSVNWSNYNWNFLVNATLFTKQTGGVYLCETHTCTTYLNNPSTIAGECIWNTLVITPLIASTLARVIEVIRRGYVKGLTVDLSLIVPNPYLLTNSRVNYNDYDKIVNNISLYTLHKLVVKTIGNTLISLDNNNNKKILLFSQSFYNTIMNFANSSLYNSVKKLIEDMLEIIAHQNNRFFSQHNITIIGIDDALALTNILGSYGNILKIPSTIKSIRSNMTYTQNIISNNLQPLLDQLNTLFSNPNNLISIDDQRISNVAKQLRNIIKSNILGNPQHQSLTSLALNTIKQIVNSI